MRTRQLFGIWHATMLLAACTVGDAGDDFTNEPLAISSVIDIGTSWTGVSVGFTFVTDADMQYIAYYDADRYLTVGQRKIGDA
ncbi:MAG TPA: hypothetical protein VGG28_16950, partial [Kofleriaceae bacterium]